MARLPLASMPTHSSHRFLFTRDHFIAALVSYCALVMLAGCVRRSEPDPAEVTFAHSANRIRGSSFDADAPNWPGWRGGAAGGVALAKNLLVQWSASSGIRWKTSILGQGNSSPVVWDDRIFLTSARQEDGHVQLAVICLDRTSGGKLWIKEPAIANGPTHRKNGFASATPITDGQRVYVSFGSAGLFSFDFDGRQLWHVPLNSQTHEWGAAASPILFGGHVIQVCDQAQESFVAAFDATTGEQRWRTARNSDGGWSTPVIVEAANAGRFRPELVINGSGSHRGGGLVVAYDPFTGAEMWRVGGTTDIVCPTPIVAGGLVIACSGRNGPILAIRPGGEGDVTSSHVAWKHGRGGAYVPTGVAVNDRLYTIRDEGVLTCYEVVNGKRVWEERLAGSFTASLVAGDGKLYATSERGVVYVVAAADKFKLLAINRLDERCLATPAIAGDELFVRTESQLYCVAAPLPPSVVAEQDEAPNGNRSHSPLATTTSPDISLTTSPSPISSANAHRQN